MRKVSIKDLYGSLSSNLERLPFAVTKHGKVIAVVNTPTGLDKMAEPDIVERLREKSIYRAAKFSEIMEEAAEEIEWLRRVIKNINGISDAISSD